MNKRVDMLHTSSRRTKVNHACIGKRIKELRKQSFRYMIKKNIDAGQVAIYDRLEKKIIPIIPDLPDIKRGLTQKDFACCLNVSVDTVKNWEQGYNYPSIDQIIEICHLFDCSFDYFFCEDDRISKYMNLSTKALLNLELSDEDENTISVINGILENVDFLRTFSSLACLDLSGINRFDACEIALKNAALLVIHTFSMIDSIRNTKKLDPISGYLLAFIRAHSGF